MNQRPRALVNWSALREAQAESDEDAVMRLGDDDARLRTQFVQVGVAFEEGMEPNGDAPAGGLARDPDRLGLIAEEDAVEVHDQKLIRTEHPDFARMLVDFAIAQDAGAVPLIFVGRDIAAFEDSGPLEALQQPVELRFFQQGRGLGGVAGCRLGDLISFDMRHGWVLERKGDRIYPSEGT